MTHCVFIASRGSVSINERSGKSIERTETKGNYCFVTRQCLVMFCSEGGDFFVHHSDRLVNHRE